MFTSSKYYSLLAFLTYKIRNAIDALRFTSVDIKTDSLQFQANCLLWRDCSKTIALNIIKSKLRRKYE